MKNVFLIFVAVIAITTSVQIAQASSGTITIMSPSGGPTTCTTTTTHSGTIVFCP